MPDKTEQTLTIDDTASPHPRGTSATCAALYLVLDCTRPCNGGARIVLGNGDEVVFGRGSELAVQREGNRLFVSLPDRRVSSVHARVEHLHGTWILCDTGSKNGVLVDGARIDRIVLTDNQLIELGHTFFVFRSAITGPSSTSLVSGEATEPGPRTLLPSLERQLERAFLLAKNQMPIILLGESGTGKEVVARALHERSQRPGPFAAVNCGAIPASLIESELFGHRKGAFSGATEEHLGLVRAADRGTLFLDEIGDLPLALQVAFLRVLQEHEVTPIGATRPIKVDLQLVSATHRDLDSMVERGDLRSDLFARLTGGTVRIPPLRDRMEDMGVLVAAILRRNLGPRAGSVQLGVAAGRALMRYSWPLNVRELEKCLLVACAVSHGGTTELEHLPEALSGKAKEHSSPPVDTSHLTGQDLKNRELLVALLEQHQGNVSAVARDMRKGRTQIQRWLKRYMLKA